MVAYFATRDYSDDFRERHGKFQSVENGFHRSGHARDPFVGHDHKHVRAAGGVRGRRAASARRNAQPESILPSSLLGGKATGKNAVRYAFDIDDVVIVSPDYAYEPRQSYSVMEFLGDLPEIHGAILDMIPSVMLALDYLERRGDVDMSKVVMMGYSFGAPFVPVIMANDARPAVAAMVYGGGDMESLIRHNVGQIRRTVRLRTWWGSFRACCCDRWSRSGTSGRSRRGRC